MKFRNIAAIFLITLIPISHSRAQSTCSDEQGSALKLCVETCESTCMATYPECQKTPLSLEEIRAAISDQCNCETSRNYGKYRSCVAQLINVLKKFSLVDTSTRSAIDSDNRSCKDSILERRKEGRGDKGRGKKSSS